MDVNSALSEMVKAAISEIIQPYFSDIKEQIRDEVRNNESPEGYLNLNNAAKYLDVTRQSLTTYIKNGVVKCYRLNGNPRFKKSDLDAAMKFIEVTLRKHK